MSSRRESIRTLAAWKGIEQQIKDLNAVVAKANLQELKVPPTRLSEASCRFNTEQGRKANK